MALIKCNNCGHSVSDRATLCPHCGKDPHMESGDIIHEDVTKDSERVSTVDVIQPQHVEASLNDSVEETELSDDVSANGGLKALVTILVIVAIIFAGVLLGGGRYYSGKTPHYLINADTTSVDSATCDSCAIDTVGYDSYAVEADTAYADNGQIDAEAEKGFQTYTDVMDYVVGKSSWHDDAMLRIT